MLKPQKFPYFIFLNNLWFICYASSQISIKTVQELLVTTEVQAVTSLRRMNNSKHHCYVVDAYYLCIKKVTQCL